MSIFKRFEMFKKTMLVSKMVTPVSFNNIWFLKYLSRKYSYFKRKPNVLIPLEGCSVQKPRLFRAISSIHNLMNFFDNETNWSENEVKCGHYWKLNELRIKSNEELHQLWFILIKERNMLLTMKHECNNKMEIFPSPERLEKIKTSMCNLEYVVQERNKAFHLLETGKNGERPIRLVSNSIGFKYKYRMCEHILPPNFNFKWLKSRQIGYSGHAVRKHIILYREKLYNEKRKETNRLRNEALMILRRYPSLNINLLRGRYPKAHIDKFIGNDKTRGHFIPNVE